MGLDLATRRLLLTAAASAVAFGCGSSTATYGDGGFVEAGDGPRLWGLSRGQTMFVVTSISGVDDGCLVNPATRVSVTPLPVEYVEATHVLSIGLADGTPPLPAFGSGPVAGNLGVLTRDNDTGDGLACTWHQRDVAMFALFDNDRFTLAVTEDRTRFATTCQLLPPGGTCTSSWTWTAEKVK
jgi:hypothetical protein